MPAGRKEGTKAQWKSRRGGRREREVEAERGEGEREREGGEGKKWKRMRVNTLQ